MGRGIKDLLNEAAAQIETCEAADARSLLGRDDVVFVDVRDEPELVVNGKLPGALHASRGMLEFYIDSGSPYHNEVFGQDRHFVFYCKSGGRSALAAQRAAEMGLARVSSMNGGFTAWLESGGPVEKLK